jgi:hypothetical protein
MPYVWTEPAEAVTHRGVSVFHVYKDDDWSSGQREFQYTTDVTEQTEPFDIRDLADYRSGEDHTAILKRAIEGGEIIAPAE